MSAYYMDAYLSGAQLKTTRKTALTGHLLQLKKEIALNREFTGTNEAAFLALVWTWQRLERAGRLFFAGHGITDAQFNALMILWDYRERTLRQHELADLLVVNRASMGSVLQRMERSGLVSRTADPVDRRAVQVRISGTGIHKLEAIRPAYYALLGTLFPDSEGAEHGALLSIFANVRQRLGRLPHSSNPDAGSIQFPPCAN